MIAMSQNTLISSDVDCKKIEFKIIDISVYDIVFIISIFAATLNNLGHKLQVFLPVTKMYFDTWWTFYGKRAVVLVQSLTPDFSEFK